MMPIVQCMSVVSFLFLLCKSVTYIYFLSLYLPSAYSVSCCLYEYLLASCLFIHPSACMAWVVTKEIEKRIMAFERKCYRKILRIGWTQKVKNTDLYGRIQLKENILQKLIGRKLGLFGHI